MTDVIAFTEPGGGVSIVTPAETGRITDVIITSLEELPKDLTFRKAWVLKDSKVSVDMDKARNIHMNNLRKMRDNEFIKMGFPSRLNPEVETAIISEQIRDRLKILRDIPQVFDLSTASSPEELKCLIPRELA